MDNELFYCILDAELEPAVGCTEPGAIALAGAYAGAELKKTGEKLRGIEVNASANIIKNAMGAGIPGTDYTGMSYAAAIGAVCAEPERKLEVISSVLPEVYAEAESLVKSGMVKTGLAQSPQKLYIEVLCLSESHKSRAVIAESHTNLVLLELDGKAVFSAESGVSGKDGGKAVPSEEITGFLTVRNIYDFITDGFDPLCDSADIVRQSVMVNSNICEKGLEKDYGLSIGRGLERDCLKGYIERDMVTNSMIITSAGADARMAGAPFSVFANSGSGNQGIMAVMPVVSLAEWQSASYDKMLRAVTLSHLILIHIKSKFGRLSAMCGASTAAVGAACGITYLLGGDYDAVCRAIHNVIGNVAGMLCDGAKADCALKISTCVNAAFQAAFMALRNVRVMESDGIVEQNVEKTIDNFSVLGNKGSSLMDQEILRIMLEKKPNKP